MEKLIGQANLGWFKDLFNSLDADGSGDLDKEEIHLAVKTTADGNADPEFLMKIADVDKSGTIDFTEFMFLFLIAQEPMSEMKQLV